jgi:hypothetical protein
MHDKLFSGTNDSRGGFVIGAWWGIIIFSRALFCCDETSATVVIAP